MLLSLHSFLLSNCFQYKFSIVFLILLAKEMNPSLGALSLTLYSFSFCQVWTNIMTKLIILAHTLHKEVFYKSDILYSEILTVRKRFVNILAFTQAWQFVVLLKFEFFKQLFYKKTILISYMSIICISWYFFHLSPNLPWI